MPVRRSKPGSRTSFFWRLLLSFVSLLLPMILVAALFYSNALEKQREGFASRVGLTLASTVRVVDNEIATTQAAGTMLLDTETIKESLRPESVSTPQQRVEQIGVISQIAYARGVAGNIVETMLLYLDNDRVYADGQYNFNDYFQRLYRFDAYSPSFWEHALTLGIPYEVLPATRMSIPMSADARTVVPTLMRFTVSGYRVVLVITLSAEEIDTLLRKNTILDGIRYTVIDSNGKTILSDWSEQGDAQLAAMAADRQNVDITLDGMPYVLMQQTSPFTGWRYFSAIPLSSLRDPDNNILTLMLVFLLLLITGLALAYLFTMKIYRPIRSIRQSLDSVPLALPAEAKKRWDNDFTEIGRGVESLLNECSEAREENRSMLNEYLDSALLQVLSSRPVNNKQNLVRLLARYYGMQSGPYRCLIFLFRFSAYFHQEMQDTERLNILSGLKSIVWETLKKKNPCYVIEHRENSYVCVTGNDNGGDAELNAVLQDLLGLFSADAHYCTILIGVGTPCDDLEKLGTSFEQTAETVIAYSGEGSAIVAADSAPNKPAFLYNLQDELALTQHLNSGNIEETQALVDAILSRNQRSGIGLNGFEMLIQELFITGMRFLASKNETLAEIGAYRDLRQGSGLLGDYAAAGKRLHAFYHSIIATSHIRSNRGVDLSATITEYVQKNYSQDLYLEKIADEMGLSVKYISKVFKEKTGQNLSDYINGVRMDHVKTMLTQTDDSIGKIAEKVGIYSRATFVRLFRKREGITPSEYRELLRGR